MRYARENPDLSYEQIQERLAEQADWERWVRKEDPETNTVHEQPKEAPDAARSQ